MNQIHNSPLEQDINMCFVYREYHVPCKVRYNLHQLIKQSLLVRKDSLMVCFKNKLFDPIQ